MVRYCRCAISPVDRLLHHAHVIVTKGNSHRLPDALTGKGVHPLDRRRRTNGTGHHRSLRLHIRIVDVHRSGELMSAGPGTLVSVDSASSWAVRPVPQVRARDLVFRVRELPNPTARLADSDELPERRKRRHCPHQGGDLRSRVESAVGKERVDAAGQGRGDRFPGERGEFTQHPRRQVTEEGRLARAQVRGLAEEEGDRGCGEPAQRQELLPRRVMPSSQ